MKAHKLGVPKQGPKRNWRSDHVVFNFETKRYECERCKQWVQVGMPIPISLFAELGKVFTRHHRRCV